MMATSTSGQEAMDQQIQASALVQMGAIEARMSELEQRADPPPGPGRNAGVDQLSSSIVAEMITVAAEQVSLAEEERARYRAQLDAAEASRRTLEAKLCYQEDRIKTLEAENSRRYACVWLALRGVWPALRGYQAISCVRAHLTTPNTFYHAQIRGRGNVSGAAGSNGTRT